jgi:hypothetical protein
MKPTTILTGRETNHPFLDWSACVSLLGGIFFGVFCFLLGWVPVAHRFCFIYLCFVPNVV